MDNKTALDNEVFVDEIPAENIVVTEKENKKQFFIFFFIIGLILIIGGFYSLYRFGIISLNHKQYISGNLFVVHSGTEFGSNISSFSTYNSSDNAYSYVFYIQNDNKEEHLYKVILRDIDYNKNKDNSNIYYEIIKNSNLLFKGRLDNADRTVLTSQSILSGFVDKYEVRLWSNDGNAKLDFKIDIESQEEIL